MECTTSAARAEYGRESAARPGPCCPVCAGPLVPLRESYRCCRCFFTLCAGCEAPVLGAGPYPPG
jgi:hypothetical protein